MAFFGATIGLNFSLRGLNSLSRGLNAAATHYSAFARQVAKERKQLQKEMQAASTHSEKLDLEKRDAALEKQTEKWGRYTRVLEGVKNVFGFLGKSISLVSGVLTAISTTGMFAMQVFSKLAGVFMLVSRAAAQMSLSLAQGTETLHTRLSILRTRFGEDIAQDIVSQVGKIAPQLGLAVDEITESLQIMLNNPTFQKVMKGKFAEGQGQGYLKEVSEFLANLKMTQPDIWMRRATMLPNILGGTRQSFKFGFEMSPEDMVKMVKEHYGGKLPAGVGYAEGNVASNLKLMMEYAKIITPRKVLESLGMQVTKQLSLISSLLRDFLAGTAFGGRTEEGGFFTQAIGRPLRALNKAIVDLGESGVLKRMGEMMNNIGKGIGVFLESYLGKVLFTPTKKALETGGVGAALQAIGNGIVKIYNDFLQPLGKILWMAFKATFPILGNIVQILLKIATGIARIFSWALTVFGKDSAKKYEESAAIAEKAGIYSLVEKRDRQSLEDAVGKIVARADIPNNLKGTITQRASNFLLEGFSFQKAMEGALEAAGLSKKFTEKIWTANLSAKERSQINSAEEASSLAIQDMLRSTASPNDNLFGIKPIIENALKNRNRLLQVIKHLDDFLKTRAQQVDPQSYAAAQAAMNDFTATTYEGSEALKKFVEEAEKNRKRYSNLYSNPSSPTADLLARPNMVAPGTP